LNLKCVTIFLIKFFHENYNLGFKRPERMFVICIMNMTIKKRSNTLSENEIKLFEIHVKKVESYKSLKLDLL
jgi:hypothetical protein